MEISAANADSDIESVAIPNDSNILDYYRDTDEYLYSVLRNFIKSIKRNNMMRLAKHLTAEICEVFAWIHLLCP